MYKYRLNPNQVLVKKKKKKLGNNRWFTTIQNTIIQLANIHCNVHVQRYYPVTELSSPVNQVWDAQGPRTTVYCPFSIWRKSSTNTQLNAVNSEKCAVKTINAYNTDKKKNYTIQFVYNVRKETFVLMSSSTVYAYATVGEDSGLKRFWTHY